MRKTNEHLDELIASHEDALAGDASSVDIHRGHVSRADGQLVRNRRDAIAILEGRKELTSVTLRAGL